MENFTKENEELEEDYSVKTNGDFAGIEKKKRDEGVRKANRVDLAAKIIFALGIAISILSGFIFMVNGGGILGVIVMVAGPYASWLVYEFLSGFAMLIKKVSLIEQHTKNKK